MHAGQWCYCLVPPIEEPSQRDTSARPGKGLNSIPKRDAGHSLVDGIYHHIEAPGLPAVGVVDQARWLPSDRTAMNQNPHPALKLSRRPTPERDPVSLQWHRVPGARFFVTICGGFEPRARFRVTVSPGI
jgi:hypothetical protein